MIIKCPWCGERDQTEFTFGGECPVIRPEPSSEVSDADWAQYLFYRNNVKGIHLERWLHSFGCRQWFNVVRDTVTHEIHDVHEISEGTATPRTSDGAS